ncbi:UNVERIFIED_CONTAM: hypothetical protein K2H54_034322 [Gekko kuhli]
MAEVSLCTRPVCGLAKQERNGSYIIWFPLELLRNALCVEQLLYSTQRSLHFSGPVCTNDSGDDACAL